jgi:hypothetical protein
MFLYGKKSGVELLVGITVFIHCFYPSFGDIFEQRFQCGAFSGKSSPTFAGKRKAEAYRTEIKLPNGRLHGGMRKDFQLIGKWKQGLEQT